MDPLFATPASFLVLHTGLEFVAIAVSIMVFSLAWNLRKQALNSHLILLGTAFLAVALIDTAHTLSYAGMPDLITPNSTEKGINFWLAGRTIAACALLAVALTTLAHWSTAKCYSALSVAVAVAAGVWWVGIAWIDLLPRTFIPGQGLTAFKIFSEFGLIFLYGGSAILLALKSRKTHNFDLICLASAAWVQALSEVFLTLYITPTDSFNLLGHLYKAIAYVMVYRAIVVTGVRIPFREIAIGRARLQAVLSTIPDLIWLKDFDGVYLSCNAAFERLYGTTEAGIVGKTDFDFVDRETAEFFRTNDRKAMAAAKPVMNEEWLTFTSDGYRGLFETTKTAMLGPNGEPIGVLGISHDITEHRRTEEKLQISASVFTHAREGIMITDALSNITDVNEAFTRITGYSREEVIGSNPRILSSGRQTSAYYAEMWAALTDVGHWTSEVWNRRKSGEVFAELQTISAIRDAGGQTQQYVSLFSDISSFKENEYKLERIAHFDALTNLPNRVLLADRLHQAMVQRRGQQLAVAFLDLDGFKTVNDSYGHEVGDQLLVAVAQRMKLTLREGDTLARMGGDEFVAVLIGLSDMEASVPMLNRLLAAAAEPVLIGEHTLQVSASLGVTLYPQADEVDGEQLLRQADQAMYQAKVAGKNRFHVFDAALDRSVRGHHDSLERIRRALTQNEFVLYYQPQVNMRTGQVIGAEALIRWQHPERGLLAPAQFLPIIENDALTIKVGDWVLETAVAQLGIWQAQGLHIPISVNVGARQLQQSNFVEKLVNVLASHPQTAPNRLELEVLETSALEDIAGVSQVIEDCRRMGVMFALDDFGTGYSSLTYLKRLPVALLKIDQSFVRDMLVDEDDLAILEGVIGLARAFHRRVIAEGVETVEHGTRLLQLGCDLAQGYGIARPMPAADMAHWAAQWEPDPAWVLASQA